MMILGAVGSTVGAGTFASFNAATSNPTSTFETGTVVLGNEKDDGDGTLSTGTVCLSTGGQRVNGGTPSVTVVDANDNAACGSLVNVTVKRPGESAYADINLFNYGTISGDLSMYASATCSTATAGGEPFDGGGDTCGTAQLMVQQFSNITRRANNDTQGGLCIFGGNQGSSACSFSASKTLATFDDHTSVSPLSVGTMAAGAARFYRVTVLLPTGSSNTMQGRAASFDFTWRLDQTP